MAIQTATAEQVCDCVMALKRHIDRVEAELQRRDESIALLRHALLPLADRYIEIATLKDAIPRETMVDFKLLENAAIALEMTNE